MNDMTFSREQCDRESRYIEYRLRVLPDQLERARLRVQKLENEARRLGMDDLLNDPQTVNRAWDREIELAKIKGGAGD